MLSSTSKTSEEITTTGGETSNDGYSRTRRDYSYTGSMKRILLDSTFRDQLNSEIYKARVKWKNATLMENMRLIFVVDSENKDFVGFLKSKIQKGLGIPP